jgi:hypothetical protein
MQLGMPYCLAYQGDVSRLEKMFGVLGLRVGFCYEIFV